MPYKDPADRREFMNTPYQRARMRKATERYRNTAKGLATRKAYKESWRGKFSVWQAGLKHIYGITPFDRARYLERQGYACAICRKAFDYAVGGDENTDHDHATGRVRGILCARCNIILGHYEAAIELPRLVEYVNAG